MFRMRGPFGSASSLSLCRCSASRKFSGGVVADRIGYQVVFNALGRLFHIARRQVPAHRYIRVVRHAVFRPRLVPEREIVVHGFDVVRLQIGQRRVVDPDVRSSRVESEFFQQFGRILGGFFARKHRIAPRYQVPVNSRQAGRHGFFAQFVHSCAGRFDGTEVLDEFLHVVDRK